MRKAVVIVLLLAAACSTSGGGTTYKAAFAKIDPIVIVDPAEVTYTIQVTNTGGAAGKPVCSVSISSPGGAYLGSDGISPKAPIPPGMTITLVSTVTITHQGAQYVDVADSSVDCS